LPMTKIVKTGGGGWHYYYNYCEGVGNKARIKELTDIRGEGGYVVAPPSLHASGEHYEWSTFDEDMVDFPKEFFGVSLSPVPMPAELPQTNWAEVSSGVSSGGRNNAAAQFIGKLIRSINPREWESMVWPTVQKWNLSNVPPLPESELRVTFNSICKKEFRGRTADSKDKNYSPDISNADVKAEADNVEFLDMSSVLDLGIKELRNTKSEDIVSFGYDWLDEQLTGIFPGELVVIGGESGTGKTTFATNVIYKASKKNKCAVYALEDRLEDYGIKALYFKLGQIKKKYEGATSVNYHWNEYRRNEITDKNYKGYLEEARYELLNENIMFAKVDSMMNIDLLEELIERQASQGVGMFLVDHLHYFDLFAKSGSKADYIERIMIRLRTLQRRTGARILLVVHYKKLEGKKPTLDSFKDSISIVQNANYVISLWRDRSVSKEEKHKQYKTKFFIPKARNPNGEGMVEVEFDSETGDYKKLGEWMRGTEMDSVREDNKLAKLVVKEFGGKIVS